MPLPTTVETPQAVAPQVDEHLLKMLRDRRFDAEITPVVSEATRRRCLDLRQDIDDYLAPPSRTWLLGRVAGVLNHFYVSKTPEQIQEIVARDWLRVLEQYPQWALDQAFTEWLADEQKRPTPAAIRLKAQELSGLWLERRERLEHCLLKGRREGESALSADEQERRRPKTQAEKDRASAEVQTMIKAVGEGMRA